MPRALRQRAVGLKGHEWPRYRQKLRVRFIGGDKFEHECVRTFAPEWSQHCGIDFLFGNYSDAELRISFKSEGGSWSFLGTMARHLPPHVATMNFGWLRPAYSEGQLRSVVLHEFGHALGLVHEHQHPEGGIPWDREKVLAFYMNPPHGWSAADVESQIFYQYDREQTNYTAFDPHSIMLYPVRAELTNGRMQTALPTELSATDKEFIGTLYPLAWRSG